MLFFLAKIDNNIAEAERRRMEAVVRPRVQPSVAEARVAAVNLPDTAVVAAPAAAVATGAVLVSNRDESEQIFVPAVEQPAATGEAEIPAPVVAPLDETFTVEEEAPAVEFEEAPALDRAAVGEASIPADAVAAATVLPSVEIEEPAGEWGAATVVAAASAEMSEREADLPDVSRDLAVEVLELEVEAPPDLADVAVPGIAVAPVVESLDADLAGVDMPELDAVDAPEFALPEAEVDELNVPPVLPREIELPRVDVPAPEAEFESDDMSVRGMGVAGAALFAAGAAAAHETAPEPETEIEPVVLPDADTRLPEIEIVDVEPEPEIAAEAALAAATGVPEAEAAAAAAPVSPETGEVAQLKAEVASLKEMLAQLAAQLLPAAGAAAVGAAAVGAAATPAQPEVAERGPEPVEPPAVVDTSNKLPGTDEVARIAAEMNAAAPRRPRTVAKPKPPETPAAEVAPAPQLPVEARAPIEAVDAAPPVAAAGEDNLEAISGLGPIYAKRLRELGVTTYAQLADAPYDVLYKVTRGNLERVIKEDWRGQARRLAKAE
jgi:predicted flap endonuclease-1-like 5' DNA nuclease